MQAALCRIATAIGKYWVCKRCPPFVNEAQESLGGAGYVEESILPRLYREAPLNSIWEGSGNIQCLDVLRALAREPASRDALLAELATTTGAHPAYDAALANLQRAFEDPSTLELRARTLVEQMALLLQASLLLRGSEPAIGATFCEARLGQHPGLAFGTLPPNAPRELLLSRALPSQS
jgi:putative acyl-CoA dehydrogenase